MSVNDAVTPGTEPVTPAAVGASTETTPAPDGADDLQRKYEALLERLTPMEQAAKESERLAQENDQLRRTINERVTQGAPPATSPQDQTVEDLEAFERTLFYTAEHGESPEERKAAKYIIAQTAHQRQLEAKIDQVLSVLPFSDGDRTEVVRIQAEAAKSGNRISAEFARSILDLQRKAQAQTTTPTPTPRTLPPNTRVTPSPVPAPSEPPVVELSNWEAMTPEQKDAAYRAERAGKYRLK